MKEVANKEANVKHEVRYEVGDGITLRGYSDMYAYTVIEVSKNGKKIKVQEDDAKLVDDWKPEVVLGGFIGRCVNQNDQDYVYTPNPEGRVKELSLRGVKCDPRYNDGLVKVEKWVEVGVPATRLTKGAIPGRCKFHDYNF